VQQLVAALLAVFGHHAYHDGIALGAFEHCRVVGLVQTVAALFLRGLEPVGLSRAADAAALTGHDLDKMVERLALVNSFEQLSCVGKTVDHRELQLGIPDGDRRLLDRRVAAQAENADLAQGVLAFIRQAVTNHRLSHAAGRAVDDRCAGAETERQAGRFQLQLIELDARLLHHVNDLVRGEHQIDVGAAVVNEFRARGLHLLRRAGHDGDVVGRAAVLRVLFRVLVAEDRAYHLHRRLAGGDVLEVLGVLVFQILHPRGAAGGEHRERASVFQPLQKFLGLRDGREVRAEGRVVHLVHAHKLERRDELIEHVFTGGDAKGLAHGHADRGRDLDDHALFRIVDGAPRLADLVLHRDRAGGAHGGALTAAHAFGLRHFAVERRHDLRAAAAIGKVQNAHALHLFAHAHAVAAEDALVRIAQHSGRGVVDFIALARILKADTTHAELLR